MSLIICIDLKQYPSRILSRFCGSSAIKMSQWENCVEEQNLCSVSTSSLVARKTTETTHLLDLCISLLRSFSLRWHCPTTIPAKVRNLIDYVVGAVLNGTRFKISGISMSELSIALHMVS